MVDGAGPPGGPGRSDEPAAQYDGAALGLAEGLMFALDVCLSEVEPGQVLELTSANPSLAHELPAWCRGTGHELVARETADGGARAVFHIRRGNRAALMFADQPDWGLIAPDRHDGFGTTDWLIGRAGDIPAEADPRTGFSPRGSVIETGAPAFP
ncbi:MAG: 5-methyltetrahydropteroyltriglutamate--homocysteine methyltransferase, partial [Actinomycetota bacterium]|nr:5-methyltetrahydropteroyltriglutamate--homocysteine methyltransferase [Actinomycetota bacterium]